MKHPERWEKHEKHFLQSSLGCCYTLQGDGFRISYNPSPTISLDRIPETAICHNDQFYILDGDFTNEYEELIDKGFEACKEFFDKHKEDFKSMWSND